VQPCAKSHRIAWLAWNAAPSAGKPGGAHAARPPQGIGARVFGITGPASAPRLPFMPKMPFEQTQPALAAIKKIVSALANA